jgi:transposase
MSMREISRRLQISRKAVKAIIQQQGQCVPQPRRDKIHIDTELLERLHRECQGRVERMHEKLHEEYNSTIGYSTLTRMLRDQGIGH